MAVKAAEKRIRMQSIFTIPAQDYSAGGADSVIYFPGSPERFNLWTNHMLRAQSLGKYVSFSGDWSRAQRYWGQHHPEQALKLVGVMACTGTVLNFQDETLEEGITLNPDGSFKEARIVLGEKDGIYLPHESAHVKDLDEKYMKLIQHLHALRGNPKRELPDNAYLDVDPDGEADARVPVIRGLWDVRYRKIFRVDVHALFVAADEEFAAWFVSREKPANAITLAEYSTLEEALSAREAEFRAQMEKELNPLREQLSSAVVLFE